jgi:hypothetical protein
MSLLTRKIIGRSEKIYFPEINLEVNAKIDTGAWRTSIHVDGFEVIDNKLHFWIGDKSNMFIFEEYRETIIKNSFGQTQRRYIVSLKMKMGGKKYTLLASLTDRSDMKYSCLIGRRFLKRYGFLVDVTKKNINDKSKKI